MAAEKNYENRMKKFLESQGIYALGTPTQKQVVAPCGYYEKRWAGGTFTKSGLPDLHIEINGYSVDVEVKSPTYKPTELQLRNIKQINSSKGIAFVSYEHQKHVELCAQWINRTYPQYSDTPIKNFEDFKELVKKLLENS